MVGLLSAKLMARLIGLAVGALAIASLVIWVMHLREKAHDYDVLRADVTALEADYGCLERPPAERALPACLAARDRDAARVLAAVNDRLRTVAAEAQAKLDAANERAAADQLVIEALISGAPPGDDGAVPKVLLDTWSRVRSQRGAK